MTSNLAIHPKVASATLAGSITAIVIYCLQTYANTDIPPTVAAAITTVFAALLGYLAPTLVDGPPQALTLPTEPPEDDTTEPRQQKAISAPKE